MLQHGANVNDADAENCTALRVASFGDGFANIVEALVHNGADVDARDIDDSTMLHVASECFEADFIEPLLENGADIEAMDDCGLTPLFCACPSKNLENIHYCWVEVSIWKQRTSKETDHCIT